MSLVFKCQHELDGCDKRIRYGNYKYHLMSECMIKRYKKIEIPQGDHVNDQITKLDFFKHEKNQYNNMFFCGDLNKMYLEEDEEIEEEMNLENDKLHQEFKIFVQSEQDKNKYVRRCDEYDDYDDEY